MPKRLTYKDFRDLIEEELRRNKRGMTWIELRERLKLNYIQACPAWISKLQKDIGLCRIKGDGRAFIWKLGPSK
jgi:arginine repressor